MCSQFHSERYEKDEEEDEDEEEEEDEDETGLPLRFCYLHSGSDAQRKAKKVLQFTIDRRWDFVIYTVAATNSARSVVIYMGSATRCHQSGAKGPQRDDAFGNFSDKVRFCKNP